MPSSSSHRDHNQAPTEVAPSTPVRVMKKAPSIPEIPKFEPEEGVNPLPEPAVEAATHIEAVDGSTQTPPLLIQGHL